MPIVLYVQPSKLIDKSKASIENGDKQSVSDPFCCEFSKNITKYDFNLDTDREDEE